MTIYGWSNLADSKHPQVLPSRHQPWFDWDDTAKKVRSRDANERRDRT